MTHKKNENLSHSVAHGDAPQMSGLKVSPINLRAAYSALSPNEQIAVGNFFAMHNCATWIFDNLSKKGQKYIETCITLSKEKVNESLNS